jgi:hypothetical protein
MAKTAEKVTHLKKVTISLEAGRTGEDMDLRVDPAELTFIFGIGTSGLTVLEHELADKEGGEGVLFQMVRDELPALFGHLPVPEINLPESIQTFVLKAGVTHVTTADQREVIRAMADLAQCGSHCCGH